MPIFLWTINPTDRMPTSVEVGPNREGTSTFLAVHNVAVWIPPEWARKVSDTLKEYAGREERGERHHIAGGRTRFVWLYRPNDLSSSIVEVAPNIEGDRTFLSVHGTAAMMPPEWARKVADSLREYADREERGEKHYVVGG